MKHKRVSEIRVALALALGGLAIVLGACSTNPSNPPATPSVTSVSIDQSDASLNIGDTLALSATVVADGGASSTVLWASSNAGVAAVSAAGLVEAKAPGTATITATSDFDGSKSDTVKITVVAPGVDPDNIYVDASAPAGGNGTSAAPFQTITAGIAAVNSGGTVHVLAGTYPENLYIEKPLTLSGAGRGSVTIVSDADAVGLYSSAGLSVYNASGVTLTGFTLQTVAPGPTLFGLAAFGGVTNLTIQDVAVEDQIDNSNLGGIELFDVTTATVQNVRITAPTAAPSNGPGLLIARNSSGIDISGLVTSGHDNFAGLALNPTGGAIADVTVQGTFAETNKMEALYDSGGGTISGLTAAQFTYVVRSTSANYGNGARWFYKESETVALADALFNFEDDGVNGAMSYVQPLDPTDRAVLQNVFIAGQIDGDLNGYPFRTPSVRSSSIQTAIDVAAPNAQIQVRAGTFTGALTLDVAGLAIDGAGGTSVLTSDPLPVLTVAAAGVTVTGVQLQSADGAHYAILVQDVTGFQIHSSNLNTDLVITTSNNGAVDAANNYWGDAGGPDGNDVDPVNGTNVTTTPFSATSF